MRAPIEPDRHLASGTFPGVGPDAGTCSIGDLHDLGAVAPEGEATAPVLARR